MVDKPCRLYLVFFLSIRIFQNILFFERRGRALGSGTDFLCQLLDISPPRAYNTLVSTQAPTGTLPAPRPREGEPQAESSPASTDGPSTLPEPPTEPLWAVGWAGPRPLPRKRSGMSPMGHASRVEPRDCLSNPAPENFQGRDFLCLCPKSDQEEPYHG